MIKIKKDMSYLSDTDIKAIDNGIAKLGVYSLRIDRFYTDEQKEENSKLANSLTRQEWGVHCEEARKGIATKVEKIVDTLNEQFLVYQYKNETLQYKDNWDLFFWCNRGDMSYVTLNTNKDKSLDEQLLDIENVLAALEKIQSEGIQVTIQYNVHYDDEKVNSIMFEMYSKIKNTFIDYQGTIGKIKVISENENKIRYGFFKKGARSNYYNVSSDWFLSNYFSLSN